LRACTPAAALLVILWGAAAVPVFAQSADGAADTGAGEAAVEDFLAREARAQLLVEDREAAADRLIAWTEAQGGYFVERSLERVVLRVPADSFGELRSIAAGAAEEIITYNPSAQDQRQELSAVRAAIESREENLERVLALLDGADVEGTLALEREISSLMRELESLRGRERAIGLRIAFARVEIALSAQAAGIPDTLPSSFEWLNTLDLYRFIGGQR
jgi:hypothetical protein